MAVNEISNNEVVNNLIETQDLLNFLLELIQSPLGPYALILTGLIYLANKGLLSSMFLAFINKTNEQIKFVEKLLSIKGLDENIIKIGLDSISEKAFKKFTLIMTNKSKIDALIHLENNTSPEINWITIKRAFSSISFKSTTDYSIKKPKLGDVISHYFNESVIKLLFAILVGVMIYLLFLAPKSLNSFILLMSIIIFLIFIIILIASTNWSFLATVKLYNELRGSSESEISAEGLFEEYTSKKLPSKLSRHPTITIFLGFVVIIILVSLVQYLI